MRARRPVPFEEVRSPEVEVDGDAAASASPTCGWRSTRCRAEQRDVIVLRFLVGLSPREIAERMGRSEDAVHGLQHRGRRRLRREMRASRPSRAAAARGVAQSRLPRP